MTLFASHLSTARIAAFEQCPKRLWLMTHRPERADVEIDADTRLATSLAVKALAHRQCRDGCRDAVVIDAGPSQSAALGTTRALLAQGHAAPIMDGTFEHDGVVVRIDILEPDDGGWRAIDVRSSTKPKPEHDRALATKLWVAGGAGLTVTSAAIRHLDRGFALGGSASGGSAPIGSVPGSADDYAGVFADADRRDTLAAIVADRPAIATAARAMLAGGEPAIPVGDHCAKPRACAFAGYCSGTSDAHSGDGFNRAAGWPVTILPRGAGKRFMTEGIADLTQVDPASLTLPAHRRIHRATVTGIADHDPVGATAAMAPWGYPRTWLDFETISDAIPIWRGCSPYDQVAFQFVADVEAEDGTILRRDFLSLDGGDPRRACAEALVALPTSGAVVAWNAGFERGVIERLAAAFVDLAPALSSLAARVVDLLPVARDHWYHRDQRGSWSIKAVLPTIAPDLDYATLEVKDGGNAVEAYREAVANACTPARRDALAAALRIYCGRDVEAMRVVAAALVNPDTASRTGPA